VRVGYFNILKAEKFLDVAEQTVKQFEAQLGVTKAFFEVGIVPKNDVLQAEVRLANARQGLVRAENDLAAAKSSFNILLRREIHTPLAVVDILAYKPFPMSFEASLEEALRQRPEIKTSQLIIDQAKENVKIAKSGFLPTISLLGNYNRLSEEPNLNGDMKNEKWTVQALATFTLWNWGNTAFKVGENKVKVTQAEDSKNQLIESITLEVKNDYLNLLVAEKNIKVAETAIEQAEENLRMNEERYKYQVATQTDVLDAVVLLAQARVNYYGALSDFNVAKAQLERSMGRLYL
jgi:outer membrane protein TolC